MPLQQIILAKRQGNNCAVMQDTGQHEAIIVIRMLADEIDPAMPDPGSLGPGAKGRSKPRFDCLSH
jgi:hypothetical protein